jgi:hypothetical protein
MRRLGYAIALLALLVCPATADTATPGLVQENLLLAITLPNGSQVKLEAMVIRPHQPGRLPLVVLVHGTPRASCGFAFSSLCPASGIAPFVAWS